MKLIPPAAPSPPRLKRGTGAGPRQRGCTTGSTCPDVFELTDGDFAVIGTDVTDVVAGVLPQAARRADHERIVARETLVRAKTDIPDA
ncbi:hypothetical protein ACFYZE_12605 [Streptomyces sp. NPDC001796]|uniref:hypothetical protein n=1 Tax=Streptomyces sp. NPDC001796 TaxID=3364609 RepID=UPI003674CBA4